MESLSSVSDSLLYKIPCLHYYTFLTLPLPLFDFFPAPVVFPCHFFLMSESAPLKKQARIRTGDQIRSLASWHYGNPPMEEMNEKWGDTKMNKKIEKRWPQRRGRTTFENFFSTSAPPPWGGSPAQGGKKNTNRSLWNPQIAGFASHSYLGRQKNVVRTIS